MKTLKKMPAYLLMVSLLGLVIWSCKKEPSADKDSLAEYVKNSLNATNKIIFYQGDVVYKALNFLYRDTENVGFSVQLNKAHQTDQEVTAQIDYNPELVKIYNSLYKSKSELPPKGLFKIAKDGKVVIKAGEMQSTDSIKIEYDDLQNAEIGNYDFLLPVNMKSNVDGGSLKSALTFIRIAVTVEDVKVSLTQQASILPRFVINTPTMAKTYPYNSTLNIAAPYTLAFAIEGNTKEMVDAYNALHETDYIPFPENSYSFRTKEVVYSEGQSQSETNSALTLTNVSLFNSSKNYLLALKLRNGSLESNIHYFGIIGVNNVAVATAVLDGALIDRKNWKVTTPTQAANRPAMNMIDEDLKTDWRPTTNSSAEIVIDMGEKQIVKGFRTLHVYKNGPTATAAEIDVLQADIYSSNDGVVWKFQGRYIGATVAKGIVGPTVRNMKFVNPVNSRYFKINNMTASTSYSVGVTELTAIK